MPEVRPDRRRATLPHPRPRPRSLQPLCSSHPHTLVRRPAYRQSPAGAGACNFMPCTPSRQPQRPLAYGEPAGATVVSRRARVHRPDGLERGGAQSRVVCSRVARRVVHMVRRTVTRSDKGGGRSGNAGQGNTRLGCRAGKTPGYAADEGERPSAGADPMTDRRLVGPARAGTTERCGPMHDVDPASRPAAGHDVPPLTAPPGRCVPRCGAPTETPAIDIRRPRGFLRRASHRPTPDGFRDARR